MRKLTTLVVIAIVLSLVTLVRAEVGESVYDAMLEKRAVVELKDGGELKGKIAHHDESNVVVMKSDGTMKQIPKAKIKALRAIQDNKEKDGKESRASNSELQYVCHFGRTAERSNSPIKIRRAASRAKSFVRTIANQIGMKQPPEVRKGQVASAMAAIYRGNRVIIYNPAFMQKLNARGKSDWAAYSVLAHELGHHLNGHTVERRANNWKRELDADYYSGFALARLGASLEETQAALRTMQSRWNSETGSRTHPPVHQRLAAVEKGWKAANATGPSSDGENEAINPFPPINGKNGNDDEDNGGDDDSDDGDSETSPPSTPSPAHCKRQCTREVSCARQVLRLRRQCNNPMTICQKCSRRLRGPCCNQRALMQNPYLRQRCQQCSAHARRQCVSQLRSVMSSCRPRFDQCMQKCMNQGG